MRNTRHDALKSDVLLPPPVAAQSSARDALQLTPLKLLASLAAFTIIYALYFTAIKAGMESAPPLFFGALRGLLGGVVLLGVQAARRGPLIPTRRSWPLLLALAATSTTIGFGAMFLSPGRTGAGIASVLGNTQPLFAVILAALFLHEAITRGKGIALVLGLAGATLIAFPALTGANALGLIGPLLALAASAGTASGSVIVKWMQVDARELLIVAGWQLVIGSLPLLLASILFESGTAVVWSAKFIGLLLFLALVGTAFVTVFWYWLLQREDVGRLTLFLFLVPVVGLLIALVVYNEPISLPAIIGVVLTVAGIGAVVWELLHTPEKPA